MTPLGRGSCGSKTATPSLRPFVGVHEFWGKNFPLCDYRVVSFPLVGFQFSSTVLSSRRKVNIKEGAPDVHFNMSGHVGTQSDTTQLVLEMSDADIDAAVRFCDDVLSAPTLLLLPPTLEFGAVIPGSCCVPSWTHRTVTQPVARIETPDVPALFMKIDIPANGVWDASVVTASGACVARWSQKGAFLKPSKPSAAPLEWGGKHFGEVAVDFQGNKKCWLQPGPVFHAKGPSQDIVFAENLNNKRNCLKSLAPQIMLFSCFTLNLCALFPLCAADDEPYEALFKTVGGEEIGGYKMEKFPNCCQENDLPKTEAVVHFGSMTAEQRRLALVTMVQGAAMWAHPQDRGG